MNGKEIDCIGFSRSILPILVNALYKDTIEWIALDLGQDKFKFAGCIWILRATISYIINIELIEGDANSEELTVAVLSC